VAVLPRSAATITLASPTLHFDVEIIDIRHPTGQELTHDHVHGPVVTIIEPTEAEDPYFRSYACPCVRGIIGAHWSPAANGGSHACFSVFHNPSTTGQAIVDRR
jgi:hypothetical protein